MTNETAQNRSVAIGERIRLLRGGSDQAEFASCLGVNKNTIGRYERGERTPDGDFLARLSEVLDVSPTWVISGIGPRYLSEITTSLGDNHQADGSSEPVATDAELFARTADGVASIYRDEGGRVSVADAVRIAVPIYDRIVGLTDPAERRGALRYALEALRQDLRRPATPTTESKRSA